jgi:hypothetical protein
LETFVELALDSSTVAAPIEQPPNAPETYFGTDVFTRANHYMFSAVRGVVTLFVQALDSREAGPTRIGEFNSTDALSLVRARAIVSGLEGVSVSGRLNARDALLVAAIDHSSQARRITALVESKGLTQCREKPPGILSCV